MTTTTPPGPDDARPPGQAELHRMVGLMLSDAPPSAMRAVEDQLRQAAADSPNPGMEAVVTAAMLLRLAAGARGRGDDERPYLRAASAAMDASNTLGRTPQA